MYHDVAPRGREDSTGFPGQDAARYKLAPEAFDNHLRAIAERAVHAPVTLDRVDLSASLLLTFDDGGVSATEYVADALERRGWRGHFFVTTAYIDRPGFLCRGHIRALRQRGHVVGSHSHTHPLGMGRCNESRQRMEWTRSVALLSDILGEPILAASVPGGHYTDLVGRTALDAGVRFLLTSRPTMQIRSVDGLAIIGRYAVRRATSAATVSAAAAGHEWCWRRQAAAWQLREVCKAFGGPLYRRGRERLLGRSAQMRWGDEPAASEDPA
jgi:peptidoglycan/xylan/chitin deacetylase (PgdA/CDA1 family)